MHNNNVDVVKYLNLLRKEPLSFSSDVLVEIKSCIDTITRRTMLDLRHNYPPKIKYKKSGKKDLTN